MKQQELDTRLALKELGIGLAEINKLYRAAKKLHRWHERECGDEWGRYIERDEDTGLTYHVDSQWGYKRTPIRDEESIALRWIESVLAAHPELAYYVQGDCRGMPLYVYKRKDLGQRSICSCYSSIGLAIG